MSSNTQKLLEHSFFFALLVISAYLVWRLFVPFVGALAFAAVIVTMCYPLHERLLRTFPKRSPGLVAFISLFLVIVVILIPLSLLASLILREAYAIFNSSNHISILDSLTKLQNGIRVLVPDFSIDIPGVVQQVASFVANNIVGIFTGTATTIFLFFITILASYYFLRDGKQFTEYLFQLSPLKDADNERILKRLASAVRSVALGSITVAIIQGILTAIGLTLFGFDRAILWGCLAAIGTFIPGVGTTLVFVPSILYLFINGSHLSAFLLALWGVFAVGLVDNMIGPYVMSRSHKVHPFLMLLSVLGGIVLFGPVGFILGPVSLSLFLVLLELYHTSIRKVDGE